MNELKNTGAPAAFAFKTLSHKFHIENLRNSR